MLSSIAIKNAVHGEISVGTVLTWAKQYTDQEVRDYYALAGEPTESLPEHLPYVLTVAPLTKLGGDLNYLSQRMDWQAARPLGRNEEIVAELEVTRLEPTAGMTKIAFDARIRCGGEVVITGRSKGLIVNA
ncbi:hypothetical protein [Streptomyces sp. NPDC126503]|uniref:hypothetical protein n=1 Tax=Streptomyces sp. NPDC126503 TaxID=3155315 RepID=UPI00331B48C5